MSILEQRHLTRLIRISLVAELFYGTYEGTIVNQRLIHLLALSVSGKFQTLRVTMVVIVCSNVQPGGNGSIDTCRHAQVHQLVLMA